VALRHEGDRGKTGQAAAPGRRQLLTGAAAGLAIGAGAMAAGAVAAPTQALAAGSGITTITPSGDTTGATDAAAINGALSGGQAVQLVTGTYYVNASIELPNYGVLLGVARPAITKQADTVILATTALHAVVCSAGWLENESYITGGLIADLQVNGNNLASNGIVLQAFDSQIYRVGVENVLYNGIVYTVETQNGTINIPAGSNFSNNRIESCSLNNCGQWGIATVEDRSALGGPVYTDGFILNSIIAGTGLAGISIQECGDWDIQGNHLYGNKGHGMQLGVMWYARVINNYIESWGQGTVASVYRAIDGYSSPPYGGPGSVIMGNVMSFTHAPGTTGTGIEGINLACPANETNRWTVIGNVLEFSVSSGFTTSNGLVWTNLASTATTLGVSTGNTIYGFQSDVTTVTDGGTITITAGV